MSEWTSERILEFSRSFMEPRIVLTAVELDFFTLLADSPKSIEEICAARKTAARGTSILLDALAAIGLLRKEDGRYVCPKEVSALLSADSPASVLPMMRHGATLWPRWSQLTEIVRKGAVERPAGIFEDESELQAFIGAMHVVGKPAASAIAEQAHAEGSRKLLDVGGATGTYAEAFLRKYPGMRATVFDQPAVIRFAEARLKDTGLMDRISLVAGDFYADELPGGHDLALLSAIIHQNSPEQNLALYQKVFRALVSGGRILIRDHVLRPDRTQPRGGAIFAVNMLTGTSGGNCYTLDDIRTGLEAAGFVRIRLLQSGERMDALVEAFKP